MNRLENGDLEFCQDENRDGTEECQSLPYEGECAVIEVDIDTGSGQTCERCILADGTVVDQGCNGVSIGCVLVTLPEPDCVVCAYVNGAIIFSSCIADQPVCTSDRECLNPDGTLGHCVDGQCIFEPGCFSDADCPPGFVCDTPIFANDDRRPAPRTGAPRCVAPAFHARSSARRCGLPARHGLHHGLRRPAHCLRLQRPGGLRAAARLQGRVRRNLSGSLRGC